jgi:hypothetical protein
MNDYTADGIYARSYEGKGMRIVFMAEKDSISISVSGLEGLTDQMISIAVRDWFPCGEYEPLKPLMGLVYIVPK